MPVNIAGVFLFALLLLYSFRFSPSFTAVCGVMLAFFVYRVWKDVRRGG